MPPTAEQTKKGYAKLWDEADPTEPVRAAKVADDILKVKDMCVKVEQKIGMPWIMVAAIWMRESSLNKTAHMHNGDSLQDFTHRVPAGRPKVGHGPPFTWEESTADAFEMKKFGALKGTWTVELMLYGSEGFNGWGYLDKGNSPYVWSWTDEYHGGKYTRDHFYDPTVWDKQPGVAAIFKALALKDASAKRWTEIRWDGRIPAGAVARATEKERKVVTGGAAAAGVGTGTGVAVPNPTNPTAKIAMGITVVSVIIIGLAIALVAGVFLFSKAKLVKERWLGTPA